jgi:hypothetical protein
MPPLFSIFSGPFLVLGFVADECEWKKERKLSLPRWYIIYIGIQDTYGQGDMESLITVYDYKIVLR